MAPEQAHGHRGHVDARTDQFALAVMTYEMLMREPPFGGDDPLTILYRVVHEETPPVVLKDSTEQGWTPQAVQATLRKALAKDPDDRFATVGEFARSFSDAVAADFGGPPAPLCLFQRPDSNVTARSVGEPRLTPEPAQASGPPSRSVTSPALPGRSRRRKAPAVMFAAAAAAAGLFYFRAEVQRALPASARAQLGAVIGQIAPTMRRLPSLSWVGGEALPAAPSSGPPASP
jgi:serine/threonine-protein kinase